MKIILVINIKNASSIEDDLYLLILKKKREISSFYEELIIKIHSLIKNFINSRCSSILQYINYTKNKLMLLL